MDKTYNTNLQTGYLDPSLLTDPDDNIIVTGCSRFMNHNGRACFTTVKYTADGGLLWRVQSKQSVSTDASAPFSQFDMYGNILVVGKSYNADDSCGLIVQRIGKDGNILSDVRKQAEHYECYDYGGIIKRENTAFLGEDATGRLYTISLVDSLDGYRQKNICRLTRYDKNGTFLWKDDVPEQRVYINTVRYYKLLFSKYNLIMVRNEDLNGGSFESSIRYKYTVTSYALK